MLTTCVYSEGVAATTQSVGFNDTVITNLHNVLVQLGLHLLLFSSSFF